MQKKSAGKAYQEARATAWKAHQEAIAPAEKEKAQCRKSKT